MESKNNETNNQMYELGMTHAREQIKNEKKLSNVKEIEDLIYGATSVPRNKSIKYIKALDPKEFNAMLKNLDLRFPDDYNLDIMELNSPEFEESLRKLLIKFYYYINYKNEEIEKRNDELERMNDNHDSLKDNNEDLVKELESVEKEYADWKEQNATFHKMFYVSRVLSVLFFLQNFFFILNSIMFTHNIFVQFVNITTFCVTDTFMCHFMTLILYIGIYIFTFFSMNKKNV